MPHPKTSKIPHVRTVFFWSLAASWLTVTSIILFFAVGYRYNTTDGIFIHAGSVTVKSEPRRLDTTIDGQKPPSRYLNIINGSYHITGLKPQSHTLIFDADGYKPWQKQVDITSGYSTEFWNLLLVKDQYDQTTHAAVNNPLSIYPGPKDSLIAYTSQALDETTTLDVSIVDIEQGLADSLASSAHSTANIASENIEWSPESTFLSVPVLRTHSNPQFIDLAVADLDASLSDPAENPVTDLSETPSTPPESLDTPEAIYTLKPLTDADALDSTEEIALSEALPDPIADYVIIDRTNDTSSYLSEVIDQTLDQKDLVTELITPQTSLSALPTTIETEDAASADPVITGLRFHPKIEGFFVIVDNSLMLFEKSNEVFAAKNLADDVLAYDLADDGIFVLTGSGLVLFDKDYDFENPDTLTGFPSVESALEYQLTAYDKDRLTLLNKSTGALIVYNNYQDVAHIEKIRDDAIGSRFSDDGKKLIHHSKNNIGLFMLQDWDAQPIRAQHERYDIMTSESEIMSLEWTKDYEHVLAMTDSEIVLSDLDDRFGTLQTVLPLAAEKFSQIIADHRRNKLFFITTSQSDGRANSELKSIDFPAKDEGFF